MRQIDRHRVAQTWIRYGLVDLYFAFNNDEDVFEDSARFAEIMGLEKFLKAVILFHRHEEYENLPGDLARQRLNNLAKAYGHDFKCMLKEVEKLGVEDVSHIKNNNFDGYEGKDLVRAVSAGYMETRYPVPNSVSDTFPIKGAKGFTHDPLCSSGITKFIYALSNACLCHLSTHVDFARVKADLDNQFSHLESFGRFHNVFWKNK